MNDNLEQNTVKVIATYKELDYKGDVKTTILTKDIPIQFDSKQILEYIIAHGSIKGYDQLPFTERYYIDVMKKYFGISNSDIAWRAYSVETEPLSGNIKFVLYRYAHSAQIMAWEDVK